MLKKVERDPKMEIQLQQQQDVISERENLDRNHYNDSKIWKYEWIFGPGFMSPGGASENAKFLAMLNLKPSDYVLDVGCGVGGNALQISKDFGSQVLGVDLSSNAVRVAYERAASIDDTRVRFLITDVTTARLPPDSFDVAYSRDAILHIPNKEALFQNIFTWLKPGGRVLITDYMTGDKEHFCDGFRHFMQCREFTLRTLDHHVAAAKKAGFRTVEGVDITPRFKELLQQEIANAEAKRQEFLKVLDEDEYEELVGWWRKKVLWIENGDMKWGLVKAVK